MAERNPHDFRGLDDWVEIFRAGEQTDSAGRTLTFSHDDLDQMVASHQAGIAAPIVIGHPQHNDPAYGWAGELKRTGDSLLARFRDVTPEFAASVEAGHYRTRSVRVAKEKGRWLVDHIGFLGAKRPSIPLAPLNYQAPAGEVHDFALHDRQRWGWNAVASLLRRLRDQWIAKDGVESADEVLPSYLIDDVARAGEDEPAEPAPQFSAPDPRQGDRPMPHSDEDLQRARDEARAQAAAEFAAREQELQATITTERRQREQAEFTAYVQQIVDDERLTPAQAAGAAEFMAAVAGIDETFEFAAGDQAQQIKKAPLDWFRDFVAGLPKHGLGQELGGQDPERGAGAEFAAPTGYAVDQASAELDRKARAYMAAHPGTDYKAAVSAVNP
jgi:hypothetical protein